MTIILEPKVFRGPCDAAFGRIVHSIQEKYGCEFETETAATPSATEEEPQRKRSRGRMPLVDKTIAVYYEDGRYYQGFVRSNIQCRAGAVYGAMRCSHLRRGEHANCDFGR